jgi:hypothetical protein
MIVNQLDDAVFNITLEIIALDDDELGRLAFDLAYSFFQRAFRYDIITLRLENGMLKLLCRYLVGKHEKYFFV